MGKTFFGCLFTKVICTFLKSVWKDGFFDTPFDLIKEKKFSSHSRVSVFFLWTKKSKIEASRVSSKWKIKIFGSNRNKPKQDLFCVCFGLFREIKTFLFRFVSVFRTFIETTETNRTVSKRTETILNFLKNTWIFSLLQFTITIQSNQKDIRFCWSLYCYFYNCTLQYINVNIFRNLSLS